MTTGIFAWISANAAEEDAHAVTRGVGRIRAGRAEAGVARQGLVLHESTRVRHGEGAGGVRCIARSRNFF